ncbi:MAG: type I 3-dehydroquinate dehydratase [Methanobacteriota archaeon]
MICISIATPTVEECLKALEGLDFAEIRLDAMQIEPGQVGEVFSKPLNLIATCRPGKQTDSTRKSLLLEAIEAGAAYVDVEVDADRAYKADIFSAARKSGCEVIVSFHDFNRTPGEEELSSIMRRCHDMEPDLVKIACKVNGERDGARLLGLLDSTAKLIVVGIGPLGRMVRIAAPLLGSPFTYASLDDGKETADGQMNGADMRRVYAAMGEKGK